MNSLEQVRQQIAVACHRVGRDVNSVELIAVSKTFSVESIRQVCDAGQLIFGESRLQEAEPKIQLLSSSISWHFIGRVQRKKVRKILPLFDVIHGVDSTRLAIYLNEVSPEMGVHPKVFLQVNIANEETKGGFDPSLLLVEIETLLSLRYIDILGLMCIPPVEPDAESVRPWFTALRKLRDQISNHYGFSLPFLSMGMSSDFEVAIEEGATHVRVGSAIFGNRAYRVDGELG